MGAEEMLALEAELHDLPSATHTHTHTHTDTFLRTMFLFSSFLSLNGAMSTSD